jgi:SAM-dependent methyltransferase
MNWRVKGVVQKVLSQVPGGLGINDWLQKKAGTNRDFAGQLEAKVEDWAILVSHSDGMKMGLEGRRLMEVGTGWFPVLPVCYSLGGVARCATYDLTRHLNAELTFRMLEGLEKWLGKIAQAAHRDVGEVENEYRRLKQAGTVEQLLEAARIDYRSPADASRTELEEASVDIVFSNSVLEHVPPGAIQAILNESARVLKPGGLSIHSANCGDHYAYFDKSITAINYLTYTGREWKFWDNELLYQNRLRPVDFIEMAKRAGLEVPVSIHRARPELLAALPGLRIAPEFKQYPSEQLCATSVDFVGRKAAARGVGKVF